MNFDKIHDMLRPAPHERIVQILEKSRQLRALDTEEVASLICIEREDELSMLFQAAHHIKEEIYGNRLVLFAPLYVSNECTNNCLYCGFRKDSNIARKTLDEQQIKAEVRAILEQGHKRILMLMGESGAYRFDRFLDAIDAAYSVTDSKGSSLRRINVEIAPLEVEEFQKLSKKKIGTYTVFQETYHEPTYRKMHPTGRKSDYRWRLEVMDRALSNGLHDVGIGALFGLYDYRFEVVSLIEHARHLDKKFGVGPHTISVPRIEPACDAPAAMDIPHPVSDEDFAKIVAVLRCSVPYTGIILSTRETAEMRDRLFSLGVSQISAGSSTEIGGYSGNADKANTEQVGEGQFSLGDHRKTCEVISSVIEQGYIPSFCTGCYRRGRVGKDFMDLAKPGLIKLHCQPNALLTLKEYLMDYADDKTKEDGEALIVEELENIPDPVRTQKTKKMLAQVEKGERDLYF